MFCNCLDNVHGFLAALTPSVFDVFPFVCFVSVCLCRVSSFLSLSLCFVCVALALLPYAF